MPRTEIFLDKYRELESLIRSQNNLKETESILNFIKNSPKVRFWKEQMEYCAEVRNLLFHRPRLSESYAVVPSEEMIITLETLVKDLQNRKRCRDIAILKSGVYSQGLEDLVKPAISTMRSKKFTHIPILEAGKVVGVFSENSLFNYVADQEFCLISEEMKFTELENYLSLQGRDVETFTFFPFDNYVSDLSIEFEENFNRSKRLGMVFLTTNGKLKESLLGILTPWDILARENR